LAGNRTPIGAGNRLVLAAFAQRGEHDEAGQFLRLGAQAIKHPGAMLGRPAICEPVFMNMCAGSWLMASVVMDDEAESSTTEPDVLEQPRKSRAGFPTS